jgi:hypothetical protein
MSLSIELNVIADRARVGCKGPAAEAWLATRGIRVPSGANRYEIAESGVLAARLATSEFLLESIDRIVNATVEPVRTSLERADYPRGVYPVLRQDFVLEISGRNAQELFLQTCAVDLLPIERDSTATSGPLVMTSMIGVSVVLTCRHLADGPHFTVWSDPSYRDYFHSQLQAIVGGIPS